MFISPKYTDQTLRHVTSCKSTYSILIISGKCHLDVPHVWSCAWPNSPISFPMCLKDSKHVLSAMWHTYIKGEKPQLP